MRIYLSTMESSFRVFLLPCFLCPVDARKCSEIFDSRRYSLVVTPYKKYISSKLLQLALLAVYTDPSY